MVKRNKQNRFTPQGSSYRFSQRHILLGALAVLVLLFLIELLKPALHHHANNPTQPIMIEKDAPTFEFYKVLPTVSLKSVHLNNLATTTTAIPSPAKTKTANNIAYTLQFASLKDVDQAGAFSS